MQLVHAIVPLAVLEAVRDADQLPDGAGADAFGDEGGTLKFGQSATVAAQIGRYRESVVRESGVDATEVAALLRLVSRRSDSSLVLSEAGRRAGSRAAETVPRLLKLAFRVSPGFIRRRVGQLLVRRAAGSVFALTVNSGGSTVWSGSTGMNSNEGDEACELYGAAAAELLRRFTPFDGALFHVTCCSRGDERCSWSTIPNHEE